MPRLIFDVRANHATGVSRYGLSLLAASAPRFVQHGWRLAVVARAEQHDQAVCAVRDLGYRVRVLTPPHDDRFVRRSPWVRDLVRDSDLYYTSHYTLDRNCPAPFIATIHDLNRLRYPDLSYTDRTFAEQFGDAELELITRELAELAPWHDQRLTRSFVC